MLPRSNVAKLPPRRIFEDTGYKGFVIRKHYDIGCLMGVSSPAKMVLNRIDREMYIICPTVLANAAAYLRPAPRSIFENVSPVLECQR